jgi:hypothetical protein
MRQRRQAAETGQWKARPGGLGKEGTGLRVGAGSVCLEQPADKLL